VNLNNRHPLRLNVGFLLHQNVGFSREFDFDHPHVQIAEDLDVNDLTGELRLTRTAQGLYVSGRLLATLHLSCSRCLAEYRQSLTFEVNDLFVYPPQHATDPLLAIPETAILDLNPYAREGILLDIPIQPICRVDCRGLCPECGNNLNESVCDHPPVELDPRFSVLKTLLSES
jgi:uncharacterized protein